MTTHLAPVFEGSRFTRVAFAETLATFYFGAPRVDDSLGRYIGRACRDTNRTLLRGAWSKHDDHDTYLAFQQAVRECFGCGLDAEFMLWRPHYEEWATDDAE